MVQRLLCFLKHYISILIVTKYCTNSYINKEGNKRLNNNMNNCVYFGKTLYYDANFAATNFVLLDETRESIRLKYENANNRKIPFRIFQCEFRTCSHACQLVHVKPIYFARAI